MMEVAVVRKSVAREVADRTEALAIRAQNVADLMNSTLQPVMINETTLLVANKVPGPAPEQREYPPLFSDLRENLNMISRALDAIDSMLSRTEL